MRVRQHLFCRQIAMLKRYARASHAQGHLGQQTATPKLVACQLITNKITASTALLDLHRFTAEILRIGTNVKRKLFGEKNVSRTTNDSSKTANIKLFVMVSLRMISADRKIR